MPKNQIFTKNIITFLDVYQKIEIVWIAMSKQHATYECEFVCCRKRTRMATKHKPIVFDLSSKYDVNQDYHLVDRKDLWKMDNETAKKRIDELNMRVLYARKHYKGRYDERHRMWMQTLARPMKSHHRLSLSLEALIALENL